MPMQRTIVLSLVLLLSTSCNPGHKINQGTTLTSETNQSNDSQATSETQTVIITSTENPVVVVVAEEAQSQPEVPTPVATPTPTPDVEPNVEDEDNNKTAMEPVPIGGAYLTCNYQNGRTQGSENYRMDCEVAPALEVKAAIASAEFYKVDAQGNRSALTILSQDLIDLKWTVQENIATMSHNQVHVVLSVPGFLSVTLTTKVSSKLNLVRNPAYWLGGEPNNLITDAEDEDCVQLVTANAKVSHQDFTGMATGPLGRMNDIACSMRFNFLCRNVSAGSNAAKWVVSTTMGTFMESVMACSEGYAFGFPLNAAEVREIIAIVDRIDRNIWVNMSDRTTENEFTAIFR